MTLVLFRVPRKRSLASQTQLWMSSSCDWELCGFLSHGNKSPDRDDVATMPYLSSSPDLDWYLLCREENSYQIMDLNHLFKLNNGFMKFKVISIRTNPNPTVWKLVHTKNVILGWKKYLCYKIIKSKRNQAENYENKAFEIQLSFADLPFRLLIIEI